jgi:hypothetical protein
LVSRFNALRQSDRVFEPIGNTRVVRLAECAFTFEIVVTHTCYPSLRLAVYQERGQNDLDHLFKRLAGFDLEFQEELI